VSLLRLWHERVERFRWQSSEVEWSAQRTGYLASVGTAVLSVGYAASFGTAIRQMPRHHREEKKP
jgi:hypothetical protein